MSFPSPPTPLDPPLKGGWVIKKRTPITSHPETARTAPTDTCGSSPPPSTSEHAVLQAHASSPEFLGEMPVLGKAGSKKRVERLLEGSTEFCLVP